MKKVFFFSCFIIFFVASFFMIEKKHSNLNIPKHREEKRAIFFSYIEFNQYVKDKSEVESKKNIIHVLDNIKSNKFNMLILQVRPFADAIYESEIFPISETVKVNGKNPSYDILDFIIQESKKRKMEVHAWINPYRISSVEDLSVLGNSSIIAELISTNKASIVEGKGIFFNPASEDVNKLIVDGVKELINNYAVDGIHFDDYFYPDSSIDLKNYKDYIENGGTLSIEDFRYNVILELIKNIYSTIKEVDNTIVFGISPEGNIENNYNKHFLDIEEILQNKGYIDYIMPQIYFGFENSAKPFINTIRVWDEMIKESNILLIPALAFYKVGSYDEYAKEGCYEWIENSNIISKQIIESRNMNNYGGFSLFRYDYIFNESKFNEMTFKEIENLNQILD